MKSLSKFGISQGRLVANTKGLLQYFPQENWQEEFIAASSVDISFIELLTERDYNPHNPVWSENGRSLIKTLVRDNNLQIYSICADYIIDHDLLGKESNNTINMMKKFFEVVEQLSCRIVVLPFLEKNNLTRENMEEYIPIILKFSKLLEKSSSILAIESLLEAKDLKFLINKIGKKNIKCVFDTGNRVNFKQDLYNEIIILNELICHVHIKDKNINDTNVILGTGLVNFNSVFAALKNINYDGNYNFETTRGTNPIKTAEYHLMLCKFFMEENLLNE
jgi:sugar phosphate isomerase/epimerase